MAGLGFISKPIHMTYAKVTENQTVPKERHFCLHIPMASSAIHLFFSHTHTNTHKSKQNIRTKPTKSKQPINKKKKYFRSREMNKPASPSILSSCQNSCYRKAYAWPSHFLFWKTFPASIDCLALEPLFSCVSHCQKVCRFALLVSTQQQSAIFKTSSRVQGANDISSDWLSFSDRRLNIFVSSFCQVYLLEALHPSLYSGLLSTALLPVNTWAASKQVTEAWSCTSDY